MIERELISALELEELVKKGIVTKEGSTYIYSGSNLTVMKEMHRDLLRNTRHKILVEEGKTDPLHKDTGWFVPDWIFADRYEELCKVSVTKKYKRYTIESLYKTTEQYWPTDDKTLPVTEIIELSKLIDDKLHCEIGALADLAVKRHKKVDTLIEALRLFGYEMEE